MSTHVLSPYFHDAAAYLTGYPSASPASTSTKLELYGLFKYLTTSIKPTTSRPSIFDVTERAKWDAWLATSEKYKEPQEAEQRYIEIARMLGWSEESPANQEADMQEEDMREAAFWDSNDDGRVKETHGLGPAVSVLSRPPPPTAQDDTLHSVVVAGDLDKLKVLLAQDCDVNAVDEYGYTPLHLACDRGFAEIVKLLLDQGAKVSIPDADGLLPRDLAREAGHEEIIILVSNGD